VKKKHTYTCRIQLAKYIRENLKQHNYKIRWEGGGLRKVIRAKYKLKEATKND